MVWNKWKTTYKSDLKASESLMSQIYIDISKRFEFAKSSRYNRFQVFDSDLEDYLINCSNTGGIEIISIHDNFPLSPEIQYSRKEDIVENLKNIPLKYPIPTRLFLNGFSIQDISKEMQLEIQEVNMMIQEGLSSGGLIPKDSFNRKSAYKLNTADVFSGVPLGKVFKLINQIEEPLYKKVLFHKLGYFKSGLNAKEFCKDFKIDPLNYNSIIQRCLYKIRQDLSKDPNLVKQLNIEEMKLSLYDLNNLEDPKKFINGRTVLSTNAVEIINKTDYPTFSLKKMKS